MSYVKTKICGVTRVEDAQMCIAAGADAIGINFAPESPRYIGSLKKAEQLVRDANVTGKIVCAGVFVNAALNEIHDAVNAARLDIVQLHGDESPDFVIRVREQCKGAGLWKAFPIHSADDLKTLPDYDCDAWLLDAKTPGLRGGSGNTFDWNILSGMKHTRQVVLAGGIRIENVARAVQLARPDWIDVASGVESAPGMKQERSVRELLRVVRGVHFIASLPAR